MSIFGIDISIVTTLLGFVPRLVLNKVFEFR